MIKINDEDFILLTDYLRENYGINLTKKRTLIESRLHNHMIKKGFNGYPDFLKYALNDKTGKEISDIVNILTTNFSYFMREWEHFRFLKEHVLPEIMPSIRSKDMRIWSAGCSTGQEPYTLAMLMADYLGDQKVIWDTQVLATDISLKALNVAKEGIYNDEAVNSIPASWKFTYFSNLSKNKWAMNEEMKKEVIFRRFNLMEDVFPFKKKFHVIFCRNVMIYFDSDTRRELIEKFYNALDNGGYLFIGQSESISRDETKFTYVKPSIYKKVV